MAGRAARLSPWLVLAVVLAHGFVLQGVAQHLRPISALKPMAEPMFTRVLQPQAPVEVQRTPVATSKPKARQPRPARATLQTVSTVSTVKPTPSQEQERATTAETRAAESRPAEAAPTDVAAPMPMDAASAVATETTATETTATETTATETSATETTASDAVAAEKPAGETGAADSAGAGTAAAGTPPAALGILPTGHGGQSPQNAPDAANATLDTWPSDTRLRYRLRGQFRGGELYGKAHVQWQRDGSAYQTQVDIDVTLLLRLVLTSQGEVTPSGLAPSAYEEKRRAKRRAVRLEADTVLLEGGRVASRPDGVQDTASQFIELSHRFSSGRDPLQVGHAVTFWMARPNGVDLWTYDVVEREMLRTPGFGVIETYRLKPRRLTNPRGTITAEIWYAPSLQYLPVRIRLNTGEADYVDLLVDTIEQR